MKFQLTAVGLACATLLSACGGNGDGKDGDTFKSQIIDFTSPGTQTLPSVPKALTATSSSKLPVTFTSNTPTICTVVDGKVVPVTKGECSITAAQAGDFTYLPATKQQLFNIVQAAKQDITFTSPGDMNVTDTPPALVATSTSGLEVSFTSKTTAVCTVSGTTLTLLLGGECEIAANQAGNNDYPAAAEQTVKFAIASAIPPVLTFAGGYKPTDSWRTSGDGAIEAYASDANTNTVAADGSAFTFNMTKQSDVPNFGGYYGVRFLAAGLTGLVAGADTTAGVRIVSQGTMKFNLMMNPEMVAANKTRLRVWLYLGHYNKRGNGDNCNVTLEKFMTPVFSGPGVMQEQSIDLTEFKVSDSCELTGLVEATELQNYAISKIEFNVPDINNAVPNAGTTNYTTSVTMGTISFK